MCKGRLDIELRISGRSQGRLLVSEVLLIPFYDLNKSTKLVGVTCFHNPK